MLYNSFHRKPPEPEKPSCFALFPSLPPFFHPCLPSLSPVLKYLSCPVPACVWPGISLAELLSGPGPVFGPRAVTQSLVERHSAPLAPALLSVVPSAAAGSASDSSLPHIRLSGGSRLIRSPAQSLPSPLECEFSDSRLQIVHLQQCQSRNTISLGNRFPPQLMLSVLWLSHASPGISLSFLQRREEKPR